MQVARDGQGNLLRLMFHGPCHSVRWFLYYTILYYIILHYIKLCYIILNYVILHYIILYYIILHYISAFFCTATVSQGQLPYGEANDMLVELARVRALGSKTPQIATAAALIAVPCFTKAKFSRGTKVSIMEPLLQACLSRSCSFVHCL